MKIYYSVQNMGDGSAYPWFFTTQALAEWDQDRPSAALMAGRRKWKR